MTCPRKLIGQKLTSPRIRQGEEKEHEEGRFREADLIAVLRVAESGTAAKEFCLGFPLLSPIDRRSHEDSAAGHGIGRGATAGRGIATNHGPPA